MRAVAVARFGATPELMELPRPTEGPGEILVRMTAAGMNPYDPKILDGILKGRPHVFPLVAGVDGAGRVHAVGDGVTRFRPGDRIYGQFLRDPVGRGTYAEFAVVPESAPIARIPDSLSDTLAAAIPTSGMTAFDALGRLEVGPGSSIVIVGASGGVGSFAVQLAAARGAEVIAVARPGSETRLRELGAREVVDVSGWVERLRVAHPQGLDALLDLMSDRAGFSSGLGVVKPGGRAATTVYAVDPDRIPAGVTAIAIDLQPSVELLEGVARAVVERGLSVPLRRTISLEEAVAVLAEIRAGRSVGKTVIAL